jgi:hypothetical protein
VYYNPFKVTCDPFISQPKTIFSIGFATQDWPGCSRLVDWDNDKHSVGYGLASNPSTRKSSGVSRQCLQLHPSPSSIMEDIHSHNGLNLSQALETGKYPNQETKKARNRVITSCSECNRRKQKASALQELFSTFAVLFEETGSFLMRFSVQSTMALQSLLESPGR